MDAELSPILERISRASGFRCDAYKESCLRRRLAVRMRAVGVHTLDDYALLLDREEGELERFLTALTINVTSFYRNAETFDRLRADVLPRLREHDAGPLRCWSAGCASGEEAYTLAMLLHESDAQHGVTGSKVWATDIDDASLETARRGRYETKAFAALPDSLRSAHVEADGPQHHVVSELLRNTVTFQSLDLLRDAPPSQDLHLILCRNVVIYFDRPAQHRLFARMADALVDGGFLILGKTETMMGESRERFMLDDIRERVYKRL